MSVFSRYFRSRRRRPTSPSRPRRVWWSCLCVLRCSVRSAMRLESIATCTSGEPVSLSTVAYSAMMACLVAVSSATWLFLRFAGVRPGSSSPGQGDTPPSRLGVSPAYQRAVRAGRRRSAGERDRLLLGLGARLEQVVEEPQQLHRVERLGQEVVDALGPGLP